MMTAECGEWLMVGLDGWMEVPGKKIEMSLKSLVAKLDSPFSRIEKKNR